MADTLDEALAWVDERLSSSERRRLKKLVQQVGIEDAITQLHMGLGLVIRNELLLWTPEGAQLRDDVWEHMTEEQRGRYNLYWALTGEFHRSQDMHPDDCSSEIMRAYLTKLMETK